MTATRLGRRSRPASRGGALIWLLCLCDAGLLIASGLVHLHLWDIAYRHVPTLDVLFLVRPAPRWWRPSCCCRCGACCWRWGPRH